MIADLGLDQIRTAAEILSGAARRTSLLTSSSLASRVGGEVIVKAEHLQRTGSFKIRGAYTRLSQLDEQQAKAGVVAASAGNHAQGVAWASTSRGIPSTVVMPIFAPLQKVEATRQYGATVELYGDTFEDSLARAAAIAKSTGAMMIHPFDDPWIIAGQGTVGLEICEDAGDFDRVVVPVGGGGLISGIALALRALRPDVKIFGVHPASTPRTIADGASVKEPGGLTSALINDLVDDVIDVEEDAIVEAILFYLERMKQIVEGAGALPVAALLSGLIPTDGRTLVVCSGGNIDPGLLQRVIRHGLGAVGRYLFMRVTIDDRPGQLQRILQLLADNAVNVLSVVHHRTAPALSVGAVEVELTLETRDQDHADEVVEAVTSAGYQVRR